MKVNSFLACVVLYLPVSTTTLCGVRSSSDIKGTITESIWSRYS
jgi:hypothetical protein